MSGLFGLFGVIVLVGFIIALILYIKRRYFGGYKTSRKNKPILSGGDWYYINTKQAPRWIKHKFHLDDISIVAYGTITEECDYAKGSHYEYKLVVVDSGHTHDNAVIRRRIKSIW